MDISLSGLFADSPFMAHGYCLSWEPRLLGLHVFSDVTIALAYYSIPFALGTFAWKRKDLKRRWLVWLAAAFIFLCGTTHLIGAVTIWAPVYEVQGVVKALTAAVSLAMAVVIWPLLPKALALPSQSNLAEANARIQSLNADLERRVAGRTKELETTNMRLRMEIAAREETEIQLVEARAAAEHASRAKSDFLAHMSHELRTPLNVVMAFSEVIADETFGPDQRARYRSYAQNIHDSGSHLLDIISDVLDLSKIEAGELHLSEEDVAPAEVIERAARMASPKLDANGIKLREDVAPTLPALYADRRLVTQTILNLLANSAKYSKPGGTLTVHAHVRPDGGIDIQVEDQGPGMSEAQVAVALTPFQRSVDPMSGFHDGVGLGLPLCSRFMEKHQGSLTIDSAPDRGTRVTLSFPPERSRPH
jgi:signal transduction histidine kinase